MELIKAKVESVRYRNESGWSIIRTDRGTIKGVIEWEPNDGDLIEIEGEWKKSSYNGDDEFVFKGARMRIPEDSRALLEYAVSITKGLGPQREEQIWAKYGEAWREACPLDVPGISESVLWNWGDTLSRLEQQQAMSDTIAFLIGKGATLAMAAAAWEKWQEKTFAIVEANVFVLAELPHYGFSFVDQRLRKQFGIGDDDPRRLDAAMVYVMEQLTNRGDTLVSSDKLCDEFIALVQVNFEEWVQVCERLLTEELLYALGDDTDYALKRDYDNEMGIWERYS